MTLRSTRARVLVVVTVTVVGLLGWGRATATTPAPTPSTGTSPAPFAPAGVVVDSDGVLRREVYDDPTGTLMRRRIEEAQATLNDKVAARSNMRKVSLTRLEKAIHARLEAGQQPTDEMLCLAGLLRLRYVFLYPDSGDIVIAGPAEGWVRSPSGRIVGLTSARPVLELQDLIVALRAYPPGQDQGPLIGCSIDPTPEGLARYQEFLRNLGRNITPDQENYIVDGLRTSLGLQKVSIRGISPNTHFAQVMVEADYRMKLIGIGLERTPVQLASYVDRANPATVSRNAMQRWYFVPDYKCVRTTEDRESMELVGDGVKLVGADEVVSTTGQRAKSKTTNGASVSFVNGFTKKYPELAARSPVFAQLRNLIDMSVAAAFIQQNGYYEKAKWDMEIFGNEEKFPVDTYNAPLEVETAVNSVWKNNQLMTPIGGGVTVRAHEALSTDNLLSDDGDRVEKIHQDTTLQGLAEGQWWWD
jgi:hypothetical protein